MPIAVRDKKGNGTLKYKSLSELLDDRISTEEHSETADVIRKLSHVRKAGCFTKSDLEEVCRWKRARAMRWVRQNSLAKIKKETRIALATRSERGKIDHLTSLSGVGIPMASACFLDISSGLTLYSSRVR